MFDDAGIDIVPSVLLKTGDKKAPVVITSEYLAEGKPLIDASVDAKKVLARKLGGFLSATTILSPGMQIFNQGAFMAIDDGGGNDKAVLVDVDPYITAGFRLRSDEGAAFFMRQLADMFWNHWCKDEEREPVLRQLVQAVADFAIEVPDLDDTFMAFNQLQLMGNGLSPKQVGLFTKRF